MEVFFSPNYTHVYFREVEKNVHSNQYLKKYLPFMNISLTGDYFKVQLYSLFYL